MSAILVNFVHSPSSFLMLRSSALYVLSFRAPCTGSIVPLALCADRRVRPAAAVAVRPWSTAGMTSDFVTLLQSFAPGILNRRT